MSATISSKTSYIPGARRHVEFNFALDNSYATGGYSITAANLGLKTIKRLTAEPKSGYVFSYDYTNKKLIVYQGDNTNAAAAPGVEVSSTTDLSAVTGIRCIASGN